MVGGSTSRGGGAERWSVTAQAQAKVEDQNRTHSQWLAAQVEVEEQNETHTDRWRTEENGADRRLEEEENEGGREQSRSKTGGE
ncbi:hypothetical protein SESBI_33039 [Sesbania bispinosa]|nr:hypothetical protein SESBI_33039 [Sesbania bispinosa]